MVDRRLLLLGFALQGMLGIVCAQGLARRVARVGFLQPIAAVNGTSPALEDFREGMRALGYREGRDFLMEARFGEGDLRRMPQLAAELVAAPCDVIVAASSPAVIAARQVTRTIPIVMPMSSDPVGDGLVQSLARPGGNLTGLSLMSPELGAKRLQILREVVPNLARPVAIVWNPDYAGMVARFRDMQAAAPAAGLGVVSVQVRDAEELERALETMRRQRPEAVVLLADPLTNSQRTRIVEFAAAAGMPVMYEISQFVDAGGLMSYGPNYDEQFRRAATYVDKILRGASAGELPIEQPAKIELVINLRAARALGLAVPQSVLVRADRIVE